MTVDEFISRLDSEPDFISFELTMDIIAEHYDYTPCRFTNGTGDDTVINEAGENEGSCKLFAFAKLNKLSEAETLNCFGQYYREDVLSHPDKTDHANIRHFMQHGWGGVHFDAIPLQEK